MRLVVKIFGFLIGVFSLLSLVGLFSAIQNLDIFYQSIAGELVEVFFGRPNLSFLYVFCFGGTAIGAVMMLVDRIWPPSKSLASEESPLLDELDEDIRFDDDEVF